MEDYNESEYDDEDDGLEGGYKEGSSSAPEKVLSMKKTAEIAAMFTNLKLDQVTNIVPELKEQQEGERGKGRHNGENGNFDPFDDPCTEDSNASLDFETSLGYLP